MLFSIPQFTIYLVIYNMTKMFMYYKEYFGINQMTYVPYSRIENNPGNIISSDIIVSMGK